MSRIQGGRAYGADGQSRWPGDPGAAEIVRRKMASTRNPWDDPEFEPTVGGAARVRERARLARIIALVDAEPLEMADLDPCGGCGRPTPYPSGAGLCPACEARLARRGRRARLTA